MEETSTKTISKKKEVWIIVGRDQFAKYGLKGINIDELSEKVGIARTSFYHFFKTKDQFLKEIVDYWIEEGSMKLIREIRQMEDPKSRLSKIFEGGIGKDINDQFMLHMRNAAVHDEYLKKKLTYIEDLRIKTLTELFRDLGFDDKLSSEKAKFIYLIYLGFIEYYKTKGYPDQAYKELREATADIFFK